MQTTLPPFASSLREGWTKIVKEEGIGGLYKGLYPLWARQIPYTMVKFATFESAVGQIYKTLGKPKEEYGALAQTGVSFLGGYIAGVGCAAGESSLSFFCLASLLFPPSLRSVLT
jgi:solute carrier family 25 phosphate transporter 3